jgi:hypothetical protein
MPLLEAEKARQLKTLDDDILSKIKSLPESIQKAIGNTFIDARFKSFGMMSDNIVLLKDAQELPSTNDVMMELLNNYTKSKCAI